jgi:hypothetical protein
VSPSGGRITLAGDGFPHLALWTKPPHHSCPWKPGPATPTGGWRRRAP